MAQPQLKSSVSNSEGDSRGGPEPRGFNIFLASIENDPASPQSIRTICRARARRAKFFSARLFADPAWDMLLELYAAELEQRRISVGGLSRASQVPGTTALRWIAALAREGLITRRCDQLDARRIYVSLSPEGSIAMSAYFASLPAELNLI